MPQRFHFANAYWFRVPVKALALVVAVFGLVALEPAIRTGGAREIEHGVLGVAAVVTFIAAATTCAVAVADSYVEIDGGKLTIRFEAFFQVEIPLADIAAVTYVDPRPRWRYRFGLATNYRDRISCSHGGELIEIALSRPRMAKLWPRTLAVRRFWVAVREHEALLSAIRRSIAEQQGAGELPRAA